jgi:anthranilate phosphoribosyltransferase
MIVDCLNMLRAGQNLAAAEADALFAALLDQQLEPVQIAAVLMGLAQKGETVVELAAAVNAMRARMIKATVHIDAIDVCGTGGDGAHTLNISTAVALVVAACGVPVAKHGNRAASSMSGATDVLSALGVNINAPQGVAERCVNALGIGYFAAPLYHPALGALADIRKSLGIRTIFNMLGPLCNPAGVTRQLVGISSAAFLRRYADVLRATGSERAVVVHAACGVDEFSLDGDNYMCAFVEDEMMETTMNAKDMGLSAMPLAAIRGGDPAHNAAALIALLNGEPSAYRDTVLFNALFALSLHHASETPDAGMARAAEAIDSGKARILLTNWIQMSNQS